MGNPLLVESMKGFFLFFGGSVSTFMISSIKN
jgi:hypothetical protein